MPKDAIRNDEKTVAQARLNSQKPLQDSRPNPPASSARQLLLASTMMVVAIVGLCRLSGVWGELRPLPDPTATPTLMPQVAISTPTLVASVTPTVVPLPTSTAIPVVEPGASVVVTGSGELQLRVRSSPSLAADTLGTLPDGALLKVLEGPETSDGYTWWKIESTEGLVGWAAENWLVLAIP